MTSLDEFVCKCLFFTFEFCIYVNYYIFVKLNFFIAIFYHYRTLRSDIGPSVYKYKVEFYWTLIFCLSPLIMLPENNIVDGM